MPISYQTVLIAAAIGIVPVFGWMWLLVRSHSFTFDSSNFVMKIFFWGVLTAVPASIFEIIIIETQGDGQILNAMQVIWQREEITIAFAALVSAAIVASIEEISKGIGIGAAILLKKVRSSNDGMVIGMLIGLAFGVTENGVYFASAMGAQQGADFFVIVMLRFILSTSAHIIYSAAMGSLLAEGFLATGKIKKISNYIFAFSIPVVIHTLFNLLLGTEYSWLSVVVIFIGFVMLWLRYRRIENLGVAMR